MKQHLESFRKDRVRKNGEWYYPTARLLAHINNLAL